MTEPNTIPIGDNKAIGTAPHLVVAATYLDPLTGALYVHRDLQEVRKDWETEKPLGPIRAEEKFGDVESWAAYVKRYGFRETNLLLTWNSSGLRAVLDYHDADPEVQEEDQLLPGRCQWTAFYGFKRSPEWEAWAAFANGTTALRQRDAIERLEELADHIIEPAPADLMNLLRTLRATVNAQADTEIRPDGGTSVKFQQDKSIQTKGNAELPSLIRIAIPVLAGHVDGEGRPVVYGLGVRVQASVDDAAHLTLRFKLQNVERVLSEVFTERVGAAQELLGADMHILRAAG